MISFALAQQLKHAGITQRTGANARYFLNEHLMINRENAIHMWYADKAKQGWDLKLEEELVYCPTVSELIEGCGVPFALSSEVAGHWSAKHVLLGNTLIGEGATPTEAIARLWLAIHAKI
jgi:hypothetical protein